jgi:hypothetical protein
LIGLAPNGCRLRLHTGHGIEHRHGPVQHPQLRATSAVKSTWPGVVDDVDPKARQ